ncbi:MAG TPA: rhodanese-like domain-containing protein [Usitatibacter sp.]|jgi:rhodanese-related sulfurtransferase|nr:rhodanese-like domain-containing protein [Usitatibacter sp.]
MGEFLMNNLALVALFVASGAMLFWPELQKLGGGGGAEIGTLEATRLMNQGSLVLDVRDEKDYAAGHLPKARHIPLKDLSGRLNEIGKFKAKPVIVTGAGARAGAACRMLRHSGFNNVFQLKGGVAAWQQASLPVEK